MAIDMLEPMADRFGLDNLFAIITTARIRMYRARGRNLGEAEHGGDRRGDQVILGNLNDMQRKERHRDRLLAKVSAEQFESAAKRHIQHSQISRLGVLKIADISFKHLGSPSSCGLPVQKRVALD